MDSASGGCSDTAIARAGATKSLGHGGSVLASSASARRPWTMVAPLRAPVRAPQPWTAAVPCELSSYSTLRITVAVKGKN
ncbi:hypothetical protein C2845_PM06G25420 [Panicum miliaceum]|uniref:Uncharacterized protein n=1 Tax=Panicum miliaceum TaxID=4540 RepID=A0A3L6R8L7_PANMI|nr:hypothetical protein C2845_PM06G25420 [Panicum miliaceum]